MNEDFSFDEWFDIFTDECKKLGWIDIIDKYTFEEDYDNGKTPEFAAEEFVKEMNE